MFENFTDIERYIAGRRGYGVKPGLSRMRALLMHLDHPENSIHAIHIAGTNGKGSTMAYMEAAFMKEGYRTGVFTSPSLTGLDGHIHYNMHSIREADWLMIMNKIAPVVERLDLEGEHPTEFEIITAAALEFFRQYTDICLIETGMGGRYDTTNCVQPILSIITNVAYDHTAFLGNTLSEIASHKAGIIKQDTPVIIGSVPEEALSVIEREAGEKQAPVWKLGKDFTYQSLENTLYEQTFSWQSGNEQYMVTITAHGKHQLHNASLAWMGLILMKYNASMNLDTCRMLDAFHDTSIPGRFEIIHQQPLIVIDGAHNPAGVDTFARTVQDFFPESKRHLLAAVYKDKDIDSMLQKLAPLFTSVTLTTFEDKRAATSRELYRKTPHGKKYENGDWKNAVDQIVQKNASNSDAHFITGSLGFISNVRHYVQTTYGDR